MADFVGHDGGELGLVIGRQNQSAVDVEKASGKAVGAGNVSRVDDFDGERNFGVGVANDLLSEAVDVVIDRLVVDDLGGTIKAGGEVAAQFEFPLSGIEIETMPDAALADVGNIVLAR